MYWFGLEHVLLDAGQMGGKGAECTPWIYKYCTDVKIEFEVLRSTMRTKASIIVRCLPPFSWLTAKYEVRASKGT